MTKHASVKTGTVHIHEDQVESQTVIVHQKDEDRFVITGRLMIESCKLGISIKTWLDELNSATEEITEWCSGQANKISAGYLVPKSPQLAVYFVQQENAFDFDLADKITELNNHLLKDFQLGMIEMFQIPKAELDRFVNTHYARTVYDGCRTTHQTVEA